MFPKSGDSGTLSGSLGGHAVPALVPPIVRQNTVLQLWRAMLRDTELQYITLSPDTFIVEGSKLYWKRVAVCTGAVGDLKGRSLYCTTHSINGK